MITLYTPSPSSSSNCHVNHNDSPSIRSPIQDTYSPPTHTSIFHTHLPTHPSRQSIYIPSSPLPGSSSSSSVMQSQSLTMSLISHRASTRYAACSWSWEKKMTTFKWVKFLETESSAMHSKTLQRNPTGQVIFWSEVGRLWQITGSDRVGRLWQALASCFIFRLVIFETSVSDWTTVFAQ